MKGLRSLSARQFGPNFIRGLGIIFCWMGLLAALGLAAASFLSFPAPRFSPGMLAMSLQQHSRECRIRRNNRRLQFRERHSRKYAGGLCRDPGFRAVLMSSTWRRVSPVDALSSGRSITWSQLGLAFTQIILLLGWYHSLSGMAIIDTPANLQRHRDAMKSESRNSIFTP